MQNDTIETLYMFDVKEIWSYIDTHLPNLMATFHVSKEIEDVVYDMVYEIIEGILYRYTGRHFTPRYDFHDPAIGAVCDQLKPWITLELMNAIQSHGVSFHNVKYTDFMFTRTAFILAIGRHYVA